MVKTILVGGQYGDEGKGKIISYIANDYEIIARGGVGPNAGHEVNHKGKKYPMRMLPCGFTNENARILIGAGVAVNPDVFLKEVDLINGHSRTGIDFRATWLTEEHIDADNTSKVAAHIGSTKTGCGPAVAGRVNRNALTVKDCPKLKPYLTDVVEEVHRAKNVLLEGTQGFMLSVLYGTYPYVTSKDVSASTIAADVGLGPRDIDNVLMVIKSYTTRVGAGPLPGEVSTEEAAKHNMQEYGTVTGRARRTSMDLHYDDLKLACKINSVSEVAITKIDVRFPSCAGKKKYSELTKESQSFIKTVESKLGVSVTLVGTGKDAEDIIDRRK